MNSDAEVWREHSITLNTLINRIMVDYGDQPSNVPYEMPRDPDKMIQRVTEAIDGAIKRAYDDGYLSGSGYWDNA